MEPFGVSAGRFDTPAEIVNLRRVNGTPYLVAGIVGLLAVLSIGHLVVPRYGATGSTSPCCAFGADGAGWAASSIGRPPPSPPWPWCWPCRWAWPSGRPSTARTQHRIGARPDATIPVGWVAMVAVALLLVTNVAVVHLARTVSRRSTAAARPEGGR